jgi:hypothetical protein
MSLLADLVQQSTSTTGTGTVTLGAAVTGFRTVAGAGIADGAVVPYAILDGTNRETGTGVVGGSGTTLTRVLRASTTGSLLNLTGSATVGIAANAGDFAPQANMTATAAPTVSNDNTQGYAVGSQWLWAANNISWTCMDAATGAAVWVPDSAFVYRDFGHIITAAAGSTSLFTNGQSGVTFNAGGTASGIASDTTAYGKFPRIRYATSASAGSFQNLRTAGNGSPTSRQSGIYFDCVWGHADAATVAEARSFCGVRQVGDVGNVNPSTLINIIGVGNDTGDANLQLMVNDGTGTATKTDLGADFPANTLAADMYRLQIFASPGASSVNWVLTRLNTGNITSGTVSADIPALATMLGFTLFRGNGATALACRYDLSYLVMTPMRLI